MLKELRDKERRTKLRWTGNQTVSLPCGVFINTFHSEFSRKGKTLITYHTVCNMVEVLLRIKPILRVQ